jgi:peptide/nickel transport system permease protein
VSTPAVAADVAPGLRGRPGRVTGSPALRLIGKRLLTAIPVLWGVTFLTFLVVNRLPGDAAQQLLGINATQQQLNELRAKLNLDEPFLSRYFTWLGHTLSGNLGSSFASDQSVTSILSERLPVTFELLAYALIVSLIFTVPVALIAARRPNGIVDRVTMAISMVGLSVANYVLALILVYIFAVKLDVLPAIGYVNPSDGLWPFIKSLTLPAISIGFPLFCFYTRLLRADILEQMQGEDYVVTAAAKGVGPWRVLIRHALPNSLFGLLTVVGLNIGTLIGVTVIIESIFALPGIGQALVEAINNRDILVVQGIVLVLAVVVVLANLITDLLYAVLDPRIRYGRTAA